MSSVYVPPYRRVAAVGGYAAFRAAMNNFGELMNAVSRGERKLHTIHGVRRLPQTHPRIPSWHPASSIYFMQNAMRKIHGGRMIIRGNRWRRNMYRRRGASKWMHWTKARF